MNKIFFVALGLAILFTTQPSPAQNKPSKAERHEAIKDLRSDMRIWFERDVYPSLKKWHQEYDASLTADDLSMLTRLRAEIKQLKESMRADMKSVKSSADHGNREARKDKIETLREKHHAEMERILDGVKPIAKRSKEKLRSIFDTNEDQIEAWRDHAREIMKTWKNEHQGMGGKKGHHGKAMGLPLIGQDGKRAALKFILWDSSVPPMDEAMLGNDLLDGRQNHGRNKLGPISISPAPSGNAANISISNVPNGAATLELFDMNGTLVRSIPVNAVNGVIDQRVDLSGLATGTYMASVNTPEGRRTGQIVVNE